MLARVQPERIDYQSLNELAQPGGAVPLEGYGVIALCRPKQPWAQITDFDREVVATGLVTFIRPSNGPSEPWHGWCLVSRLNAGMRLRNAIELTLPPDEIAYTWVGPVGSN
jgi:hypothetical protein